VAPGSVNELAAAVCRVLSRQAAPADALPSLLANLRARFDWNAVATRYCHFLMDMIRHSEKRA
jgi:glycosyltransferase involved in cell wall biosynthesis